MIIKFKNFLIESILHEYEVTVKGIDFIVKGYFTQGDKEVMYYSDGSGYPGSSDTFDIQTVWTYDEDSNLIIADNDFLNNLGITYQDLEEEVLIEISKD